MSESSESGALSLSSGARHIDFHSSRRIYVVLVAHSIALSLHYYIANFQVLNIRIFFPITDTSISVRKNSLLTS